MESKYKELLDEIKEFYDYVLNETIELMNIYNCKSTLEIYCLFNMVNSNLIKEDEYFKLLYSKEMVYSKELEEENIRGIQTILNGGVCRHRAAMLSDIYRKMNIDSVVLYGLSETLLKFNYTGSLNKQVADKLYVNDILKKLSEGAKITDFKKTLKKRKISYRVSDVHDDYYINNHIRKRPNHAIVMAGCDKRYYLDPMNDLTYYKDSEDNYTLKNNVGFYFFNNALINRLRLATKDETYLRLLKKSCSCEEDNLKDIKRIKEIYLYLKQYRNDIDEFVKKHNESFESIRNKCLILK